MTGDVTGLYEFVASRARDEGDRPLLWHEGTVQTYTETLRAIHRRAALLREQGVERGDRVALLVPNHPEFVYLLFGASKIGATCAPLDYRQTGDTLAYLLDDVDPALAVVDEAAYDAYRGQAAELDGHRTLTHRVERPDVGTDLTRALPDGTVPEEDPATVAPNDVAVVSYTSGTTGPPKGVLNPHRAFVDAGRRAAEACRTGREDRGLLVLPLFHANPLTYGLMHMVAVGGSIAIIEEFSASRFFPTARAASATFFTHVGSILEILTRHAREADIETETPLRFAMGGAAHFAEADQRWFESTFSLQVLRLYGMTEIGAGLVTACEYVPDREHGPVHQGRVEDGGFDVRILDRDELEWVESGESGEILIRPERPATMFRGYRGKPDTTVEEWQDLWLHTGDLGRIDDDGNLRFLGRLKTTIRKGGENVSPWEIETALEDVPTVEEVVAVGVPDQVTGEEIHLHVVPDGDVDERQLYQWCRERLPAFQVPRYITLVDELPRTSTQKVARVELSERGTETAWDADDRPE